jgi:hypothetical protein
MMMMMMMVVIMINDGSDYDDDAYSHCPHSVPDDEDDA